MTALDYAPEMHRLSDELETGLADLRSAGHAWAVTENEYRKAKAAAWLNAPKGTVPEREAWVNAKCADERQARDIAEAARFAAAQAVKSRQVQISALQSLLAAERAEAEFVRTGPGRAA